MKRFYRRVRDVASVAVLVLSFLTLHAQERVVSGRITDDSGSSLPGVNVIKKGTTVGTATDANGNFSIQATDEDILVFSFIGYEAQEVRVGTQTQISVQLIEDVSTLEEVVVVGYGELKRADISSAQTSINSEDIRKTVNTTLDQAIQGRAAGVVVTQNSGQPGGGISVNIRGISSITGTTEPLYVIDGVQMQPGTVNYGSTSSTNNLANLNPSDIEGIEILQGPSATAIYGSRATNGVVLITTKRGKSGETKVNYDYLYSLQDKPEPLPVMNLQQYAATYNDILRQNGSPIPEEYSNLDLLGAGTNWQNELFRTAALQKHQVSLSGGSENTQYYLSGESFDQEGIVQGSGFKRSSVRLNLDNQVRDWLKVSANLNFSQTKEQLSSTQQGVIGTALALSPAVPVKNPDGTWGGADDANGSSVQFTPLNPIAIANLVSNDLKRREFLGGLNADLTIVKGLHFRTSFNANIGLSRQDNYTPTWRLGNKTNDLASLSVSNGNNTYWNWNQLLQYNKSFGDHEVGIMVSHEAQESGWENISASRTGFVSNQVVDINLGDSNSATNGGGQGEWAMESYFGRLNYSFADKYILQAAIRTDGSVNFGADKKWGTFPSASAAWRISEESFMQDISFITDLKLRVETGLTGNQGNTSYYGPLVGSSTPWGAGFILGRYGNDILQWEETSTINGGLNAGVLNNRIQLEVDVYKRNTDNLLLTAPLPAYLGTAAEGSISPPPINIGSLETKGYAISLHTFNLDMNGFTWRTDLNFSHYKSIITEFYSDAAFVDRAPWYVGNNWAQRSAVGKEPWLYQGYVYEGLYESVADVDGHAVPADNNGDRLPTDPGSIWVGDIKFKDLNGDGIITELDKTDIGNPWPKLNYGISNTFSYKGFDLTVLLVGVYGNDVYNLLRFNNTNPNNIFLGRNLLLETWNYARIEGTGDDAILSNPETGIPRLNLSTLNGNRLRFTDQFVEDGSYLRVKNVQLNWNVPAKFLGTQNVVHSARLGIGAQNLFTFTTYSGYDPEVGAYVGRDVAADNQSVGLDIGRYPLTPVYTFNVSVEF